MDIMPRPRPPRLQLEVTRHGKAVWYVRAAKGPRIRIRAEFGAWRAVKRGLGGVLARRSRPATIIAVFILAAGCVPAVSITCLKIFSRCRRVPAESDAHVVVSR